MFPVDGPLGRVFRSAMTPVDEETSRPVDYTEKGSLAVITLNRPERLNTLTEAMIAGVADGASAR